MRAGLCPSNQAKRTSGKDGRGQSIRLLAYTSAAKTQASHKWLPRVTNKICLSCILQFLHHTLVISHIQEVR